MEGLMFATVVMGMAMSWPAAFASWSWYQRLGDRRLAAEVSAALSFTSEWSDRDE
jgi:hypothetical protein